MFFKSLLYLTKCQNTKKLQIRKLFYLFQKRALNALSVRKQHSEWLAESNLTSENVFQDVPKEADVVIIGEKNTYLKIGPGLSREGVGAIFPKNPEGDA